jgi:hypothetical protein
MSPKEETAAIKADLEGYQHLIDPLQFQKRLKYPEANYQ